MDMFYTMAYNENHSQKKIKAGKFIDKIFEGNSFSKIFNFICDISL